MKKLGFDIVLLGMITSGKETQANILKKKYALKFVETGVYSRKLLKEKSKNGDWARRTVGKGYPLPVVLIKNFLIKEKNKGAVKILTKKPVTASRDELSKNPRARSAKLRAVIKI